MSRPEKSGSGIFMLIRIKSVTWDIIWAAPILNLQNLPMQYMYIDFSAVKIENFIGKKKKKKKYIYIYIY